MRSCWRHWPSPRRPSRSSRSRFAACRRRRSARWRSRSPRGRRARRRCRTSATRSAASRSSAWRGCVRAQRRRRVREQRALARARHFAFVGRARHPARQLHRARPHAAALHPHRRRDGRVSRSDARESRTFARRRVFRDRAAGAGPARRIARAGVRVGAAQRHAVVRRAAGFQGAAAGRRGRHDASCRGGHRARLRSRTSSCGTSTTFSTECSRR